MENLIFRKLEAKDYNEVFNLINVNIEVYKYIQDEKTLNTFLELYFYGCLFETTYTQVAIKNDKIVGLILGNIEKKNTLFYKIKIITKILKGYVKLSKIQKTSIFNLKPIFNAYIELKKHTKLKDLLTLFIVSKEEQGKGIGKELVGKLEAVFTKENITEYYLFSDSNCNYGFYEHNNFKLDTKVKVEVLRENKTCKMEVFLYTKKICTKKESIEKTKKRNS